MKLDSIIIIMKDKNIEHTLKIPKRKLNTQFIKDLEKVFNEMRELK